jgi:hypothetical protein
MSNGFGERGHERRLIVCWPKIDVGANRAPVGEPGEHRLNQGGLAKAALRENEQFLVVSNRSCEILFFFHAIAESASCNNAPVLEWISRITHHALRSMHKETAGGNTRIEAAWMSSHARIA